MDFSEILITLFSFLVLLPTMASLSKYDEWWIRAFDFPRIQISLLVLLVILIAVWIYSFEEAWHYAIIFVLAGSLLYQTIKIYPYTPLSRKQVLSFHGADPTTLISVMISNVLMTNDRYDKLIELVNDKEPDILLTLESDKKWEKELEVIENKYPYSVKVPQDNYYGMHLYSKMKLEEIEVKYLIKDTIPSIHGFVRLNNDNRINIHCVHPKPPSPSESEVSTNRDAELLLVGKDVKKDQETVLVFGDLNDVAWSRTTKLFLKISGLLDPRIGRGFYNTYHAQHKFFRWPLDHVFHTDDFTLIELTRMQDIGSDHFPIYIKLNYEPRAEKLQQEPEAPEKEEEQWAEEKIEEGNPQERDF